MLATYGVDIHDPAVSLRRIGVLLEFLPPQARRGGEAWSTEAELLAGLIDHVAYLTWVTMRAAGGKQGKPKPVRRPPERAERIAAATRRRRALPAARSGPQAGADGGPVKTGSWAEAVATIAGSGGVRVRHG
jgi:hypothetical protein